LASRENETAARAVTSRSGGNGKTGRASGARGGDLVFVEQAPA
jgi:hypothetical protein